MYLEKGCEKIKMYRNDIVTTLDKHIFNNERAYLIRKIVDDPDRFVGVFRSTTPRLKLIQYLLQSREIRFGDALEIIIRNFLHEFGYINLDRKIKLSNGKKMNFDQYFTTLTKNRFYLVEQKIRDDHDSSKKTGQLDNFKKKLEYLQSKHGNLLEGIIYFVDPALTKNRKYYEEKLQELRLELGIQLHLFYDGEFFKYFRGNTEDWDLLNTVLLEWRETVPKDVNIDCDNAGDLEELKSVEALIWYKFVTIPELWTSGVVKCVFSKGTNLKELSHFYKNTNLTPIRINHRPVTYHQIADLIQLQLVKYYTFE
jgi:hypothetical protein